MKYLYLLLLLSSFCIGQTTVEYSRLKDENIAIFNFNKTETIVMFGDDNLIFNDYKNSVFTTQIDKEGSSSLLSLFFLKHGASEKLFNEYILSGEDAELNRLYEYMNTIIPESNGVVSQSTKRTFVNGYPALCVERIKNTTKSNQLRIDYVISAIDRLIFVSILTDIVDMNLVEEYKKSYGNLWQSFVEQKIII
ncbi:hypothetical protein [Empedobacter sp. GD03797]|uniref:hypothetical protein n=1 Tax=Empedobacter sp. GD03797 TaxID=2975382 RepID=UPI00244CE5F1|nr:hypothetical protein [Empedobacter sp. GD03797]MDH1881168.1 hypothetical protein [Empedobacter sp. GD03797]